MDPQLHLADRVIHCCFLFDPLVASNHSTMATDTGPPAGTVPYMTPFPIADDPPPPQPIPPVLHSEKTLAERASARFSLTGKHAVGKLGLFATARRTKSSRIDQASPSHWRSSRAWPCVCESAGWAWRVSFGDFRYWWCQGLSSREAFLLFEKRWGTYRRLQGCRCNRRSGRERRRSRDFDHFWRHRHSALLCWNHRMWARC